MATTINSGYANSPKLTANIADHADVYGGRGLIFDGNTDYLNCSGNLENKITTAWTISAWVKPADVTASHQWIVAGSSSTNFGLKIYQDRVQATATATVGISTAIDIDVSSVLSNDTWVHIVWTADLSDSKSYIYINGEQVGSDTSCAGSYSQTSNFIIGRRNASEYLNATLSDVKIFDTALTEAQVQELYKKPENTPIAVQDNLVAWYPMCEGNPESPQSIVYDHSEKKLGGELITASLDTGSGITSSSYITYDGKMNINASGQDFYIQISNTADTSSQNLRYRLVVTVDSYTSGSMAMAGGSAGFNSFSITNSFNDIIYPDSDGGSFQFRVVNYVGVISSISLKKIEMGNHATTNFFGDNLQTGTWNNSDFDDGSELITNGTMEANSNWGNGSTAPASQGQSNEQAHSGTYSWKFTTDGSTSTGGIKNTTGFTTVTGRVYKLNYWIYNVGSNSHNLTIIEGDGSGAISGYNNAWMNSGQTNGQWNEITIYYVESSGGSSGFIEIEAPSASDTWYIDDVSLKEAGFSNASASGFRAQNSNASVGNDDNAYGDEISFVAGKTYKLSFTNTVNSGTMGSVLVGVTSGTTGSADNIMAYSLFSTTGDYSYTFTPTSTVTRRPSFRFVVNGTYDFTISNFEVKEVGISSSGFDTAVNEPVVPQVPLMRYNQKMFFDGSDGYVQLPAPFSYTIHSISSWFIADVGDKYIFSSQDAGTDGIAVAINLDGTIWYAIRGSGSGSLSTTTAINFNQLNHVVATYDGSTAKVYINGVLGGSASISDTISTTTNARIGALSYSGIAKHSGTIHDVSFWNTALTETQAQELFNDGVALDATTHSKKGNLLGYWRNDGVTTWKDRRGWSALTFDSTDYIDCGTAIGTLLGDSYSNDLTISAWFKLASTGTTRGIFEIGAFGGAHGQINIWYANTGNLMYRLNADWTRSVAFSDLGWNHVAVIYDASSESNSKMYLNGSSVGSASSTFPSSLNFNGLKTIIGGIVSSSYNWEGDIKSIGLYNVAKSQSEIEAIYNAGINSSEASNSGIINYWELNNASTVKDLVGSSDGTINGTLVLNNGNDGDVQGSPDSITIREGLNTNRDGLGFYFTNPSNNVLRLNGVDEHLKLPYTKSFDMGDGSFTVSAWVKTTLGVGDSIQTILWARDNDNSFKGFEFQIDDSADRPRFVLSDGSGGECNGTTNSVESDKWHFVAVVVDKENDLAKIFLSESDGSALKCQTTTDISGRGNINATPDWYVGKRNGATTQDFMGIIDELMVYNIALTAFESDGTTVEAGDTVTSGELLKNYKFSKGKHKND